MKWGSFAGVVLGLFMLFIASGAQAQGCGSIGPSVQKAFEAAKGFYNNKCKFNWKGKGSDNKIAVSDHSLTPPKMYIFDQGGSCMMSTEIAFGAGGTGGTSKSSKPRPCSEDGTHLTPPGMHVTDADYDSPKYGQDCILLKSLEGQGSGARKILIHKKESAGSASTWGCTGIDPQELKKVLTLLGNGSVVYNYFGDLQPPAGCDTSAGMSKSHNLCAPEGGSVSGAGIPMPTSYGIEKPGKK